MEALCQETHTNVSAHKQFFHIEVSKHMKNEHKDKFSYYKIQPYQNLYLYFQDHLHVKKFILGGERVKAYGLGEYGMPTELK